jgi:hypothetical protein
MTAIFSKNSANNFLNKFNFKTGDSIRVFLLKQKRIVVKKMAGILQESDAKKHEHVTKIWTLVNVRKYWQKISFFGRIARIRKIQNKFNVFLYHKKKKQMILMFLQINAFNVVSICSVRISRTVRRKNLSFILHQRSVKLKKIFPLRRVRRKKKKVK